jgi:hypothetical protein
MTSAQKTPGFEVRIEILADERNEPPLDDKIT